MSDYRGITAYAGFGPTIYRPEQVDSSLWLVKVSHYPDSRIIDSYYFARKEDAERFYENWLTDEDDTGTCTWTQDEDDGFWYTECGNAYEFMEDGPEENNHKFCPYCGGRLNAHEQPDP